MVANKLAKAVIPSGDTTSNAVDIREMTDGFAFEMPAAFTGATFTLHGSRTKLGTFSEIVNSAGTALSITASDGKMIALTADQVAQLAPIHWLKIVSAGAEAAERTVWILGD